ncbi:uncharacterized protein LOC134329592 [Trichomycterus rosablanca]|uniref:uncharacterized protein LOC134329592 n=1 Tax=Trichomycterus rosablanca TaxID=2290929 RepID=UPI002F34F8B4
MKRLLVLLSLFFLTEAERQDLSGKMFTFPVESNTAYLSLIPEVDKTFVSVTVCLRAFSDISRAQSLFSLSVPSNDNAFLIFKPKQGVYEFYVLGQMAEFWGLQDDLNVWNSVCATWDGTTGLVQLWVNGNPSSRKGVKNAGSLTETPKIILGQEQDSYGGSFDSTQSFVGMLTDVHMWDSVLSPDQITYYTYGLTFQPGNVLNWNSLQFAKNGNVIVESQKTSQKAVNLAVEMKRLLVLLSLFFLTEAERQDLSGKMFTFPVESNTAYLSLIPEVDKTFVTVTVCLRAFSDISRAQSLFSLSVPSNDNAFLIFKPKQGVYHFYVLGQFAEFWGLQDDLNVWNSVCATWDGTTGLVQLWVNGNPSSRKGVKNAGSLTETPKIILGQEQDSYGGLFDSTQSFVGMLTDVHMWDSVLSPDQITYYTYGLTFQPGNVLNWNSLQFAKNGNVIVESQKTSQKAVSN